jgi:hypothetical protein
MRRMNEADWLVYALQGQPFAKTAVSSLVLAVTVGWQHEGSWQGRSLRVKGQKKLSRGTALEGNELPSLTAWFSGGRLRWTLRHWWSIRIWLHARHYRAWKALRLNANCNWRKERFPQNWQGYDLSFWHQSLAASERLINSPEPEI